MSPATTNPVDPAVFADLEICELWDGWESIQHYAIIRGPIPVGRRVDRRLPGSSKAPSVVAELREVAPAWPAFRLRKPVASGAIGVAKLMHPYVLIYGFSTQLVALADSICGSGGWRVGMCSASSWPTLAKMRGKEPYALIAAVRGEGVDW